MSALPSTASFSWQISSTLTFQICFPQLSEVEWPRGSQSKDTQEWIDWRETKRQLRFTYQESSICGSSGG